MPPSLETFQESQFPLRSLERFAYIPDKKKRSLSVGEDRQLPAALSKIRVPSFWGSSAVIHSTAGAGAIWPSPCCLWGLGFRNLMPDIALVAASAVRENWSLSLSPTSRVFC